MIILVPEAKVSGTLFFLVDDLPKIVYYLAKLFLMENATVTNREKSQAHRLRLTLELLKSKFEEMQSCRCTYKIEGENLGKKLLVTPKASFKLSVEKVERMIATLGIQATVIGFQKSIGIILSGSNIETTYQKLSGSSKLNNAS